MRRNACLTLVLVLMPCAVTPARTAPLYTVRFGGSSSVSSATAFRRDTSFALYTSNGTGQFTGGGCAGPGFARVSESISTVWSSGFSGGNTYGAGAQAQATDFIINGPPGSVTGTLHLRAIGDVALAGGFPNNNAHDAQFDVRADITGYGYIYGTVLGSYMLGNFGSQSSGCLAGQSGPHVDVPFSLTCSIPANAPLNLLLTVNASGASYGNSAYNDGLVQSDVGGMYGDNSGRGLRLDASSGVFMTLPAGYTLNVPSWGIVNNAVPNQVGVEPQAAREGLRLELAGANPSSGETRVTLALPRDGVVRVAMFDISGREVRRLVQGWQPAGVRTIAWDGHTETGAAAPAGLYFVRAAAQGQVLTRGVVRMK